MTCLAVMPDQAIRWSLDVAPWPSSEAALRLALDVLPHLADDDDARVIVMVLGALADLREELHAIRRVHSAALALAHEQHLELSRLRARLSDLRQAPMRDAS